MVDSTTGGRVAAPTGDVSHLDDRIDAIADERRRRVLERTATADGSLSLDELVDELVDASVGATPLATDPDHVALRLHHVHLPKLDDVGLVEYDLGEQRVASTDVGERFCSFLDGL